MSDKIIMLITAFISVLTAIWALFAPSVPMALALLFNAFFSVYHAYKLEKKVD